MTIRFPVMPQTWGYSTALQQLGGSRIPFEMADRNGNGTIKSSEMANLAQQLFPALTNSEARQVGREVNARLGNPVLITRGEWPIAEEMMLGLANQALATRAPAGWGNVGSGIAIPNRDGFVDPRYGSMPMHSPELTRPERGAIRASFGLLKQIPILGNILNGADFLRDLAKMGGALLDPRKSMGDVMKAGADALFHGIGAIPLPGLTNIAGGYDVIQGGARAVMGPSVEDRLKALPAFDFNPGQFSPIHPMPNVFRNNGMPHMNDPRWSHELNPGFQRQLPWGGHTFAMPNYLPHFDNRLNRIPFENWAMPRYQQFPWDGSLLHPMSPEARAVDAADKEMLKGAGRVVMGTAKMLPIPLLGNVLNGIDFLRDIWKLGKSIGDPTMSTTKAAADLLFHGVGIFAASVGGAYDLAQGAARVATNDASKPSVVLKHMSRLPEFQTSW